jgi:hypothetical protein
MTQRVCTNEDVRLQQGSIRACRRGRGRGAVHTYPQQRLVMRYSDSSSGDELEPCVWEASHSSSISTHGIGIFRRQPAGGKDVHWRHSNSLLGEAASTRIRSRLSSLGLRPRSVSGHTEVGERITDEGRRTRVMVVSCGRPVLFAALRCLALYNLQWCLRRALVPWTRENTTPQARVASSFFSMASC